MFTGIVDHCGCILKLLRGERSIRLSIETQFSNFALGESIAVNGVCLTVIDPEPGVFQCDISPETYQLTNLGDLREGDRVNLERALSLSDRLGGHIVLGHVDKTCQVANITKHNEFIAMSFSGLNKTDQAFLVKKGSICVNGVSLTINELTPDGFEVMLIPHTLERTNLHLLKIGARVNLEFDWMAKIIINRVNEFMKEGIPS